MYLIVSLKNTLSSPHSVNSPFLSVFSIWGTNLVNPKNQKSLMDAAVTQASNTVCKSLEFGLDIWDLDKSWKKLVRNISVFYFLPDGLKHPSIHSSIQSQFILPTNQVSVIFFWFYILSQTTVEIYFMSMSNLFLKTTAVDLCASHFTPTVIT